MLKSGNIYVVSDVSYNNEALTDGLIQIDNIGWFSFNIFEPIGKRRLDKIEKLLNGK